MYKYIAVAVLCGLLSGCSALDIAKLGFGAMSPSGGVQADLRVAGEANDQIVAGDQREQEIKGETVSVNNTENITEISDTSPLLLFLLVLGWLLPSPREIWRGLLESIKFLKS